MLQGVRKIQDGRESVKAQECQDEMQKSEVGS
jgi:hypothetical protein